jgi:hypothetical protein
LLDSRICLCDLQGGARLGQPRLQAFLVELGQCFSFSDAIIEVREGPNDLARKL